MFALRCRLARAALGAGRVLVRRMPPPSADARTLVFAPHPDDEVLGCGGSIIARVRAHALVRVVIMTDGRTSHARWMASAQLACLRKAEAADAAHELGLTAGDYTFLDFADGELGNHAPAAVTAARALIEELRPTEIFVPHRADVQPDHEATFSIVAEALTGHADVVNVFEYPVWLWHSWPWTWGRGRAAGESRLRYLRSVVAGLWHIAFGCRLRLDVSAFREQKLRALGAYRSQMERREGNPRWPVMSDVAGGELLERLTGATETFRVRVRRP